MSRKKLTNMRNWGIMERGFEGWGMVWALPLTDIFLPFA